jgi:beta-glucosidase
MLGLFDDPFVADTKNADKIVHTPQDDQLEFQLNKESLVLLKNRNGLLPLNKNNIKNILVTGPLAAAENYAVSRYGPSNNQVTSILEGIKAKLGNSIAVDYKKGCEVTNVDWPETEIIPSPLTKNEQDSINMAVTAAKNADVIIAVLGEDEKTVGESLSRTSLDLPGRQEQLLQALYDTGKPIVLVLINGQPLTINWADRYIPSILEAWFPGPSGGKAIADALFGDYNPGGKLSITFPKTTGQIEFNFPFKPASQSDGKNTVNGPLYPFGFGLSYTTFEYSNLTINPAVQTPQKNIEVTVDITNTGKVRGDEVAQLYIRDILSGVITYETQLRGFERVSLLPEERKTVKFILLPDHLALLDKNMNWVTEQGEFEVLIGSSSADIRLKKSFDIK